MAYLKITTILNGFSTLFTFGFYIMFTLGEITLTCHRGFKRESKYTWSYMTVVPSDAFLLLIVDVFNWLGGLTQLLLTELTEVAIDATSWYWCHSMSLDATWCHLFVSTIVLAASLLPLTGRHPSAPWQHHGRVDIATGIRHRVASSWVRGSIKLGQFNFSPLMPQITAFGCWCRRKFTWNIEV